MSEHDYSEPNKPAREHESDLLPKTYKFTCLRCGGRFSGTSPDQTLCDSCRLKLGK